MFQRLNGLTKKNASQDGLVCWVQEESQFSSKLYPRFLWNSDVKDLKIRLSLERRDESSGCADCHFLTPGLREQSLVRGSRDSLREGLRNPGSHPRTSHLRARPEQGCKRPTPLAGAFTEPCWAPESLPELPTPSLLL